MKITAQHKAIGEYYKTLGELRGQRAANEGELRRAFQGLMVTFGREQGWTLLEELQLANGCRPDGTLRDPNFLYRGYWEAKDSKDDLETEIKKKIARGYPTTNTIFEDTQHAVLYQQGRRVEAFDLTQPRWLSDLLNEFFNYTEAPIETFERAVAEFKDRIPDLAHGLLALITQERGGNKRFQRAFADFHTLCQSALNPQISVQAIDEMLIQHLLTERLFSSVFDNPDFIRRNVIAVEIEKVIDALTSQTFSRSAFLGGLDRFYVAIEEAARSRSDWSEKQAFMNTVYERFFQGFAVKQADTYGIVYTPQEIVNFMVASVDEVLKREFGKDLSAEGVQILDPCTGTGSFIVNILRRISGSALERKYRNDLFANEIMLLPYYIAALNIEHAYFEQTGHYLPFEGICFADTLDMLTEGQQTSLFSEANTARVERESNAEITVIIGNPPYNVGQVNENDNNKNRQYKHVDERVRDTYTTASKATNRNALSDVYVKFFRWATDRLGDRDGIVCFVSNNSFVDQLAFDGMRKYLLNDFTQTYHLDLHGNVRKNPKLSGTTHNVFGIQVGVGITVAVRNLKNPERFIHYYRVPEMWRKTEKLAFLVEKQSIGDVDWQELQPDEKQTWLTEGLRPEFNTFLAMGTKEDKAAYITQVDSAEVTAIFKSYTMGVMTSRDDWVYDFNYDPLIQRVAQFIEVYNSQVDKWKRAGEPENIDNFVLYDDKQIKWSRDLKRDLKRKRYARFELTKIRKALYRPFTAKFYFLDPILSQDIFLQPQFFPNSTSEAENMAIVVGGYGRKDFAVLASPHISDYNFYADPAQCFPFYTYDEDGSNRKENITDWALGQFQAQYGADVDKRAIFHYVYALLHHPQYRERYAENLKRELPRIPLVPGREAFDALAQAGAALADLHLHYEQAPEYPLQQKETSGERFTYRVKKMRLSSDRGNIIVNDALTLTGVPPEGFAYRLGNRSALEWVIDQYQVSTDARSGITTDPNREDEPDYIVRLLKRVVTVSLETTRIVGELAQTVSLAQLSAE